MLSKHQHMMLYKIQFLTVSNFVKNINLSHYMSYMDTKYLSIYTLTIT
jgi:hypothetical protein